MATPPMIDMARTNDGTSDVAMPCASPYPYGLCICLTQVELEKLGIDHKDWAIGDIYHLHALTKVTSISSTASDSGENTRVELQITALGAESEDAENEEAEGRYGYEHA